ncbi:MAG: hypothetical protein K2M94_01255 [Paramuribaculum sp.]|nr:hypothetical protein [Paramuribaculum sp.]
MVLLIMLISVVAIILSLGFMIKSPKFGVWLYKGAVFIIMIIVLFVALFFYLGGNADVSALNINLHPWRNYLLYRVIAAIVCVTVIFAISQIPLLFVRCYHKSIKKRIIKYEGLIYAVVLVSGVICLSEYSGVGRLFDDRLQAGNDVVRMINEYNRTHSMQCQSLLELGLKPVGDNYYEYKGMWFLLDANDKSFDLRFRSPQDSVLNYDFTYSSDVHEWKESIIW